MQDMWRVNGEGKYAHGFDGGNMTETDLLEDLDIDGNIILKLILKKSDLRGLY